jgi:hypothetical protein
VVGEVGLAYDVTPKAEGLGGDTMAAACKLEPDNWERLKHLASIRDALPCMRQMVPNVLRCRFGVAGRDSIENLLVLEKNLLPAKFRTEVGS